MTDDQLDRLKSMGDPGDYSWFHTPKAQDAIRAAVAEITTDTPEEYRHLIGRKNEAELFGMPTGSVTIDRIRRCPIEGTLEIRMSYRPASRGGWPTK